MNQGMRPIRIWDRAGHMLHTAVMVCAALRIVYQNCQPRDKRESRYPLAPVTPGEGWFQELSTTLLPSISSGGLGWYRLGLT